MLEKEKDSKQSTASPSTITKVKRDKTDPGSVSRSPNNNSEVFLTQVPGQGGDDVHGNTGTGDEDDIDLPPSLRPSAKATATSATTPDLFAFAGRPDGSLNESKQREVMARQLRQDFILTKTEKQKALEEKIVQHKAELVKKTMALEDYKDRQRMLKDEVTELQLRLDHLLDENDAQQKKLLVAAFSDLPDERYNAVQDYFHLVEESLQNRIGMLTADLENERHTRLSSNAEQRARLLDKLQKEWEDERETLRHAHETEMEHIIEDLNHLRAELDLRPPIPEDSSVGSIFTLANIKTKLGKSKAKKVPPPTGTLALLFTDVQDSTALWDTFGDVMAQSLELHNDLIRSLLPQFDGYEVKTEGDAFMVAFGDAVQALKCSLVIQTELMQLPWPLELLEHESACVMRHPETQVMLYRGLRIRMGLHWGAPICTRDVNTRRMDYFGGVVNLAARVGGAGHGGQLVVSEDFLKACQLTLPKLDVVTRDLGEHQLKGLRKLCGLHEILPKQLMGRTFAMPNTVTTALKAHKERDKELAQNYAGGAPPVGRVALVFTDVQDSTALWDRDADVMAKALDLHNDLMRQCIGIYGGFEVKTEGDAFMIAFSNSFNALAWCLAVQEKLLELNWPPELLETQSAAVEHHDDRVLWKGLRVRMGIHVGNPKCNVDPTLKRMDYFGPMVNLSARVGGAGHGGQIIISGACEQELQAHVEKLNHPIFTELGDHKLKGISKLCRLVQVSSQRLKHRVFQAPSTVTSMMKARADRDQEMAALHRQTGRPAPTGRVTLVFTDVEGSTSLWDDEPEMMSQSLDLHNGLMRELIIKHSGFEVKTEGDAFMIAFGEPLDAVRWCLETQVNLLTQDWPPEILALAAACEKLDGEGNVCYRGLRVRMGIHVGEPKCDIDPTLKRMDYYGPMVNLSARISGAGHGGQIIISDDIAWLVENNYLSLGKPQLTPLGEHRLKGIKKPENLHQLLPYEYQSREFPPPSTVTTALAKYEAKDSENRIEAGVAPVGVVALVFTDVQSSTQLWDTDDVAMAGALAQHNALMRKWIKEKNGYEVKTEGDAFMISFDSCVNAVSWCLTVQERLLEVNWDQAILDLDPAKEERDSLGNLIFKGLRVRMGVHWGKPLCDADPVTGRMDYHGPMVNLSARIGGSGHGGQVVISEPVLTQIDDHLASDDLRSPVIQSLGLHRLKGISDRHKIIQVTPRALKTRAFAAPTTVTTAMARHAERDKMGNIGRAASRVVAPTGQVCYVFTKVSGIDELWDQDVEMTSEALFAHSQLVRKFVEFYHGYEVKKDESDGFFVAFQKPADGFRFALTLQEELLNVPWKEALLDCGVASVEMSGDQRYLFKGLRLQVGLHYGSSVQQVDHTTRIMDYQGPEVTISSSLCEAAHGGQILCSKTAMQAIEDAHAISDAFEQEDLGVHRLRGVRTDVTLLSIVPQTVIGRTFPSPKTVTTQVENYSHHANYGRSKRAPPKTESGEVTLVVTDIPKSMDIWETMPDVMEKSLAVHHDVVRANIEKHQGYEVRTEGDAFLVAFETAAQAVDFGMDLQNELLEVAWPEELIQSDFGNVDDFGLAVGIGIHTGKAVSTVNPNTLQTEFMGAAVNEAASLAEAAHGGQILISGDVLDQMGMDLKDIDDKEAEEEEEETPEGSKGSLSTKKLGTHRLSGVKKPVEVVQVGSRARRVTFPAPKTITTRSTQNMRRVAILETSLKSAFDALNRVKSDFQDEQIQGDDLAYDPEVIRLEKLITDLKTQIVSAKHHQKMVEKDLIHETSPKFAALRQDLDDIDEADEDEFLSERVLELQEKVRVMEQTFTSIGKQLRQFVSDQDVTENSQPTPAEKLVRQQIDMLHFMVSDLQSRYALREKQGEPVTLRHSNGTQTTELYGAASSSTLRRIDSTRQESPLARDSGQPSGSVVNMNFSMAMKMKNLSKSPSTTSRRGSRMATTRSTVDFPSSGSSSALARLGSRRATASTRSIGRLSTSNAGRDGMGASPLRRGSGHKDDRSTLRSPRTNMRQHSASEVNDPERGALDGDHTDSMKTLSVATISDDGTSNDDQSDIDLAVRDATLLGMSPSPVPVASKRSAQSSNAVSGRPQSKQHARETVSNTSEKTASTSPDRSVSKHDSSRESSKSLRPESSRVSMQSSSNIARDSEPQTVTGDDFTPSDGEELEDILDGDGLGVLAGAAGLMTIAEEQPPTGPAGDVGNTGDRVTPEPVLHGGLTETDILQSTGTTMGMWDTHDQESLEELNLHGEAKARVTRTQRKASRPRRSPGPSGPDAQLLEGVDLTEGLNRDAYKPPAKRKPRPQRTGDHPYVVREMELYSQLVALKLCRLSLQYRLSRVPDQIALITLLDWTPHGPDHLNEIEEFMARSLSYQIEKVDAQIAWVANERASNQQAAIHTLSCLIPIVQSTLGDGAPALSPALVTISEFGDRPVAQEPTKTPATAPVDRTQRIDKAIRRSQTIKTNFHPQSPRPPSTAALEKILATPTPGTPGPGSTRGSRAVTAEPGTRRGRAPPMALPVIRGAAPPRGTASPRPPTQPRAKTAGAPFRTRGETRGEHDEWSGGDIGQALWPTFSSHGAQEQ